MNNNKNYFHFQCEETANGTFSYVTGGKPLIIETRDELRARMNADLDDYFSMTDVYNQEEEGADHDR